MHARLPKLSDHCFFPFFLLPLPGPWSVSWCLSCWISSSCSANREFMLENLNLNLRSAGCTFFIFISPCQVFAHDTKLCLIACCSSCSLLSQPPLLPLQSANRDGLSSQRKSPLHLALSSSIFSPSLLLCNSLAVAASNSKLKATALLSASRRLPTLICAAIFLSLGFRTTYQFFNPALPDAFQLLFSCSHDLKQENSYFCFDFGLFLKHTSSRSMFSLTVIPVSPSLAFSNLKGDKIFSYLRPISYFLPQCNIILSTSVQYHITCLSAILNCLPKST